MKNTLIYPISDEAKPSIHKFLTRDNKILVHYNTAVILTTGYTSHTRKQKKNIRGNSKHAFFNHNFFVNTWNHIPIFPHQLAVERKSQNK